jgi:hypothetical protein
MLLVEVAVLDTRSHSGLGPAGDAEHGDARPRIHAESFRLTRPAPVATAHIDRMSRETVPQDLSEICPLSRGSRLLL